MRDRLIELIKRCTCHYGPPCDGDCGQCHNVEAYDDSIEYIADLLLENGVIVPPCKVGDTVYSIKKTYSLCRLGTYWDDIRCDGCEVDCDSHVTYEVQEEKVLAVSWDGQFYSVRTNHSYGGCYKGIGMSHYSVFLTREQAEKAIAEVANGTR